MRASPRAKRASRMTATSALHAHCDRARCCPHRLVATVPRLVATAAEAVPETLKIFFAEGPSTGRSRRFGRRAAPSAAPTGSLDGECARHFAGVMTSRMSLMRATREPSLRVRSCSCPALGIVHALRGNLRALSRRRGRDRSGASRSAPKEQPPRKLSGKRTAASAEYIWKVDASRVRRRGHALRRKRQMGRHTGLALGPGRNVPRPRRTHPRIAR